MNTLHKFRRWSRITLLLGRAPSAFMMVSLALSLLPVPGDALATPIAPWEPSCDTALNDARRVVTSTRRDIINKVRLVEFEQWSDEDGKREQSASILRDMSDLIQTNLLQGNLSNQEWKRIQSYLRTSHKEYFQRRTTQSEFLSEPVTEIYRIWLECRKTVVRTPSPVVRLVRGDDPKSASLQIAYDDTSTARLAGTVDPQAITVSWFRFGHDGKFDIAQNDCGGARLDTIAFNASPDPLSTNASHSAPHVLRKGASCQVSLINLDPKLPITAYVQVKEWTGPLLVSLPARTTLRSRVVVSNHGTVAGNHVTELKNGRFTAAIGSNIVAGQTYAYTTIRACAQPKDPKGILFGQVAIEFSGGEGGGAIEGTPAWVDGTPAKEHTGLKQVCKTAQCKGANQTARCTVDIISNELVIDEVVL